eukprot:PhM_4_TR6288/c1_g1_i1/m.93824
MHPMFSQPGMMMMMPQPAPGGAGGMNAAPAAAGGMRPMPMMMMPGGQFAPMMQQQFQPQQQQTQPQQQQMPSGYQLVDFGNGMFGYTLAPQQQQQQSAAATGSNASESKNSTPNQTPLSQPAQPTGVVPQMSPMPQGMMMPGMPGAQQMMFMRTPQGGIVPVPAQGMMPQYVMVDPSRMGQQPMMMPGMMPQMAGMMPAPQTGHSHQQQQRRQNNNNNNNNNKRQNNSHSNKTTTTTAVGNHQHAPSGAANNTNTNSKPSREADKEKSLNPHASPFTPSVPPSGPGTPRKVALPAVVRALLSRPSLKGGSVPLAALQGAVKLPETTTWAEFCQSNNIKLFTYTDAEIDDHCLEYLFEADAKEQRVVLEGNTTYVDCDRRTANVVAANKDVLFNSCPRLKNWDDLAPLLRPLFFEDGTPVTFSEYNARVVFHNLVKKSPECDVVLPDGTPVASLMNVEEAEASAASNNDDTGKNNNNNSNSNNNNKHTVDSSASSP